MMHRTKFTMIEMLVVICILVILAGMTYGIMKMVWRKNAQAVTTTTIGKLDDALAKHYKDHGYYPQQSPSDTTNINAHRLSMATVSGWRKPGSTTPYVEPSTLRNDGTRILDYWKQPLRYRSPGIMNPEKYDLWSTGADKVDGNGSGDLATALTRGECDDLRNW